MKCFKCGLPKFDGVAGYAGPQCKCFWTGGQPRFSAPARPQLTEREVVERCIRILLDGKFWNGAPAHEFEAAKNRAEAMRAALEGGKP